MSFKISSHKNSTNERREIRANNKYDARTAAESREDKMQRIATAILAMGCIKADGAGFTVTMAGGRTFKVEVDQTGVLVCDCFDHKDFGICAHAIAARRLSEMILAEETAAAEEIELPSKGFVHVTERKVIAAIERVSNQEFSARVHKIETGRYEVYSLTSGSTYEVELNRGIFGITAHCSCPDFTNRRLQADEVCKHQAAVYYFERREMTVHLNEFNMPDFAAAA